MMLFTNEFRAGTLSAGKVVHSDIHHNDVRASVSTYVRSQKNRFFSPAHTACSGKNRSEVRSVRIRAFRLYHVK
jgi:hypothetical protein